MDKFKELLEELKQVFSGKGPGILDSLFPVLVFIICTRFIGFIQALYASLAFAGAVMIYRLIKKQSPAFAAGGVGSALLAAFFAFLSGSAEGYYLPGFISGGLTVLACVFSIILKRPLAAYSSKLTRRWPIDWYWHPRVRPAYSEVTIFWGISFGARLALELFLYLDKALEALGTARIVLGWPFTILVLIVSYLYGQKRLRNLAGPSVEEFRSGKQAPWIGQMRGF